MRFFFPVRYVTYEKCRKLKMRLPYRETSSPIFPQTQTQLFCDTFERRSRIPISVAVAVSVAPSE